MPEITWELFDKQVAECRLCPLCQHILNKVPGQGDRQSPLMFIGEGPGQTEDEEGLAFVGAAGQLLTKMLEAIQLPRDRVYICNIVKCRPPHNRVPTPEEAEACRIHLRMQTWLVRPKVIVLLGSTAAKNSGPASIRSRTKAVLPSAALACIRLKVLMCRISSGKISAAERRCRTVRAFSPG